MSSKEICFECRAVATFKVCTTMDPDGRYSCATHVVTLIRKINHFGKLQCYVFEISLSTRRVLDQRLAATKEENEKLRRR